MILAGFRIQLPHNPPSTFTRLPRLIRYARYLIPNFHLNANFYTQLGKCVHRICVKSLNTLVNARLRGVMRYKRVIIRSECVKIDKN